MTKIKKSSFRVGPGSLLIALATIIGEVILIPNPDVSFLGCFGLAILGLLLTDIVH